MISKKQEMNRIYPVGAYFLLTDDCNLKCEYCFANTVRSNKYLSFEKAKIVVDSLFINAKLRKVETVYIKFSGGGEPTLKFNIMRKITNYSKKISENMKIDTEFHLATNGQWLNDELTDWIIDNIDYLLISIDGDEKTQNFQRPRIDNRNSFITVASKISKIKNKVKSTTARLTVSNRSVSDLLANVNKMYEIGFNKVQIEPLLIMNDGQDLKLIYPNKEKFVDEYIKCINYANTNSYSLYSSLDVYRNDSTEKYFCGHQNGNTITVTPKGIITACPEKCDENNPEYNLFLLGKIDNFINYYNNANLIFQQPQIRKSCLNCICAKHCKGGCISKEEYYNSNYLCYIVKNIFLYRQSIGGLDEEFNQ